MNIRLTGLVGLGFAVLLVCASSSRGGGDSRAASAIGRHIAAFELRDIENKAVRLDDFGKQKVVVVIFVGCECPINNAYMPTLRELHKNFADRSVQLLAVNSNSQDSAKEIATHARKHELPFPVLRDEDGRVADMFGARRTPEAFVLDGQRKVRYHGRIDDQIGIDFRRPAPTRRDLQAAIEEILADRPVQVASTEAAGCIIGRAARQSSQGVVTYAKEVSRILQKNCQDCHRPGQVGPMALLDYDDASAWAETIREVLVDRRMPPWYADPRFGKFSNDRSLSAQDRQTLLNWIEQGCPRGDDRELPPPRAFSSTWAIGEPEIVFSMKQAFEVPAVAPKGGIEYQNFEVETNFQEDRWVQRAEARAGDPSVVHHIVVFTVPPGLKFIPKRGNAPLLCGTAPGDMPLMLPPGYGRRIPKGSRLVFQMHYTASGKPAKDLSSIGLIFCKEPPKYEVHSLAIANMNIRIPPGDDNYRRDASFSIRWNDAEILSFMPHMHLRGKSFMGELIYPDGRKETLLSVPRYNFGWQSVYRLQTPVKAPRGARILWVAHFDNSTKNLNNPDPKSEVRWGDQTWEEMMIGWTEIAIPRRDIKK